MITQEKLPEELGGGTLEVEWELGDQFDDAGDGHVFMHQSTGYSLTTDDVFYGDGIMCDGEWTEVDEVYYAGKEKDL